jgi:hypothetical protein
MKLAAFPIACGFVLGGGAGLAQAQSSCQAPTCIRAPTSQSLTDSGIHVWTFAGPDSQLPGNYLVMRDGVLAYNVGSGVEMTIDAAGTLWVQVASGQWFMDNGIFLDLNTGSTIVTTPSTPSPDGTVVVAGDGKSLIDSAMHVWVLAGPDSQWPGSYLVMRDGARAYNVSSGVKMTIQGGRVWVQAATGQWYMDTGAFLAAKATEPTTPPASTPPTNGSPPDGMVVAAGDDKSLTDSGNHVWKFAGSDPQQPSNYLVMRDGVRAYNVGSGIKMVIQGGTLWVQAASGQWFMDTGLFFASKAIGPTIPPPPPPLPSAPPPTAVNCVDFTTQLPTPPVVANALGDEFVGPFASWADLKRDYGAKGDGLTDDTAAIQAALGDLSAAVGKSPVLYIPAGTYLVTQTVMVQSAHSIGVIGADPSNTVLKWAGAKGGTLLHINGVSYSRFNRITFEGSGTASVLVDQSGVPNTPGGQFDTGNEYADDVFQNASIGIQGGQYGIGAAESSILRSRFLSLSNAGISLKNFNALDWWIWYSYFENNSVGITNAAGAGNFHAFNNVFKGSTMTDLELINTGTFNFRDNFSINSRQFLNENFYYTNAAVTRVQGNTVITPADNGCKGCSIYQGNMGPTILTDNTFVSSPNATGAAVIIMALDPADCISVGNTYTQNNTVQCGSYGNGNGRLISQDDHVISASSVNQTPPVLPGVVPNFHRKIFDAAAGSSATQIQAIILQAAAYCGQRPVVHLPYGNYQLSQTITIPANCDIQLMGDGEHTVLSSGNSPAFALRGPSRALLRDFYLNAGSGVGIEVENGDQPGSRIYMEEVSALRALTANIFVDSLDYTLVELHDFQLSYTAVAPAATGIGLKVTGGPLAQQGKPQYGRTNLLAGSGGANYLTYQASQGANLIVRDAWYESNFASNFAEVSDNSNATFEGLRIANSGGQGGLAAPTDVHAVQVSNLSCKLAILSSAPDSDVKVTGTLNGQVWVSGNNFSNASKQYTNLAGPEGAAFNLNRYYEVGYGSKSIPDITAVPGRDFIRQTLAQSRNTHPSQITDLAPGVTDVRLYRVTVELGNIGIHLSR